MRRLLDLFCCQGGAGAGYARAGFEVVGVDKDPQPRYPFKFYQGDALEFLQKHDAEFDLIHASPPCQGHSITKHIHKKNHVDLIPDTRKLLRLINKPYIIENVVGAPMESPIMLCGTMFDLKVLRHRLFETSFYVLSPPIRSIQKEN